MSSAGWASDTTQIIEVAITANQITATPQAAKRVGLPPSFQSAANRLDLKRLPQ